MLRGVTILKPHLEEFRSYRHADPIRLTQGHLRWIREHRPKTWRRMLHPVYRALLSGRVQDG
jgi:hypothetical protein